MQLIKREHQYSRENVEYDVLDRREIIEIVDALDISAIRSELMDRAYDNAFRCDYGSRIVAELSVETGEVYYSYDASNETQLQPDLYVTLGSASASPTSFEWTYEEVLDCDWIDEFKALVNDKDGEFYNDESEAFEFILEKNGVDRDDYIKDYFVEFFSEYVEIESPSEIIEQIQAIYSEGSIVDEEMSTPDKKAMITYLNEDGYNDFLEECDTKHELIEKVISYMEENCPDFDFGVDLDKDDFEDEYDYNEAVEKAVYEFVESRVEWDEDESCSEYCIYDFNGPCNMNILTVDRALNFEIEHLEVLPVALNIDIVNSPVTFMQKWKDEEGYKYIYLVTHQRHVVVPYEYTVVATVYSNKKIDNVFEYLKENENIEIGEFGTLGANHFVQECEDFDVSKLAQYRKLPGSELLDETVRNTFYID